MRIPAAALAATILLSPVFAAPARAAVTQPSGDLCSYEAVESGGQWHLVFSAGPLSLVDEDDPTVVHTGTVTCSIQGENAADHTGSDWVSVTSDPATGQAVLPPTAVSAPPGESPLVSHLCTRVDVDGEALYWHDPSDRNVDGWWSTSPSALCEQSWQTMDLRAEDRPGRYVWSAAVAALGEADVATPVAESAVCDDATAREALGDVWRCGYPSASSTISIARLSAGGALVRSVPLLWACSDVHTGLPVTHGSALTTPDPGVACAPPAAHPVYCDWVQVSGYLAPTTLGRVAVTNSCGGISVTRQLTPAQGRLVEQWSGDYYGGQAQPWRCATDEDTTFQPAYLVVCGLLGHTP